MCVEDPPFLSDPKDGNKYCTNSVKVWENIILETFIVVVGRDVKKIWQKRGKEIHSDSEKPQFTVVSMLRTKNAICERRELLMLVDVHDRKYCMEQRQASKAKPISSHLGTKDLFFKFPFTDRRFFCDFAVFLPNSYFCWVFEQRAQNTSHVGAN